ncbi:MAG TPA: tetratricopeptide repeat protein [Gemmatimonadaceae bacterium]|nr:tetratricopeptide repeat protein [Gemmatimonadaceae bacterium]
MTDKVEWFRRTTWTPDDAADFAARLARSRGAARRAQYLRIQALHLHEVGSPALTAAALQLLDQLLALYPERSQITAALNQRAACLVDLGRPAEALESYRQALATRRAHPHQGDDGYLDFGELVLALRRDDLYDTALAAIDEFGDGAPFPVQRYRQAAIRALIADARRDAATAREWARAALDATAETESPFPHHRKLGLVARVDPDVHERLRELAM